VPWYGLKETLGRTATVTVAVHEATASDVAVDAARVRPTQAQRRTCPKLIRFSAAELEEVTTRARICGRPVACYIREVSLGRRPKGTNAIMSNTVIRELARVATRLRGLGLVAAERDLPEAAEFDAALQEVLQFIRGAD
jgi:hypothetical protein